MKDTAKPASASAILLQSQHIRHAPALHMELSLVQATSLELEPHRRKILDLMVTDPIIAEVLQSLYRDIGHVQ
jgi:hypothetical protein